MTPIDWRFDAIWAIGCIACRKFGYPERRCQVHHQNLDEHAGQLQLGDSHTVGLCEWHHQGITTDGYCADEITIKLGPSMKHQPIEFREKFGSDEQLLQYQNELIEDFRATVVGGVPRRMA